MTKSILIPTDGSRCATVALETAIGFAADLHSVITFLVVTEPFHVFSADVDQIGRARQEYQAYERARANSILEEAQELARKQDVSSSGMQIEHTSPYEAIIKTAQQRGADLIAMGSHGHGGIRGLILGSVAQKVLTHCDLPVLILRERKASA